MGVDQVERNLRKVTKIGNSLGVTFSRDSLKKINLDVGDDVEVVVDEKKGEIVLRKALTVPYGLDTRFFQTLKENVDKYRETIEGLKDR